MAARAARPVGCAGRRKHERPSWSQEDADPFEEFEQAEAALNGKPCAGHLSPRQWVRRLRGGPCLLQGADPTISNPRFHNIGANLALQLRFSFEMSEARFGLVCAAPE
jgi:hypothetical protein